MLQLMNYMMNLTKHILYCIRMCVCSYYWYYLCTFFLKVFANVTFAHSIAQAIKAIDKIHLEVNAGPSRHPTSARQLLETLRRLSKVYGYPFTVVISALAPVFHPLSAPVAQWFYQEATKGVLLSSDSASSVRRSHESQHDIIMEVRDTCSKEHNSKYVSLHPNVSLY